MARPRSKDLARAADQRIIDAAEYYTVMRFLGRTGTETGVLRRSDQWERTEFHVESYPTRTDALAAARAHRTALGRDDHGRVPGIYAVGPGGVTVHVE